jgi:hypothetical protein
MDVIKRLEPAWLVTMASWGRARVAVPCATRPMT